MNRRTAAVGTLADYLTGLWIAVGAPSTREIAARVHATGLQPRISHTTVAAVLRMERLPSVDRVTAVGTALGGNPDRLRELWAAAKASRITPKVQAVDILAGILAELKRIADAVEHRNGQ